MSSYNSKGLNIPRITTTLNEFSSTLIKITIPLATHKIISMHTVLLPIFIHRGADKSLARPISLSIVFTVQGTDGSPKGPDPENRVGDQDIGSPGKPVSSGSQVPGEPFPSWSG
jgi:hypothetical protein